MNYAEKSSKIHEENKDKYGVCGKMREAHCHKNITCFPKYKKEVLH